MMTYAYFSTCILNLWPPPPPRVLMCALWETYWENKYRKFGCFISECVCSSIACSLFILSGDFFSMYRIQHCFTHHPSNSTVQEDAGIEPRTVATSLTVRPPLTTVLHITVQMPAPWNGVSHSGVLVNRPRCLMLPSCNVRKTKQLCFKWLYSYKHSVTEQEKSRKISGYQWWGDAYSLCSYVANIIQPTQPGINKINKLFAL